MQKLLLCLFLICLLSAKAVANYEAVLNLDSLKQEYTNLNRYLWVLQDSEGAMCIDDVVSPYFAPRFAPYRQWAQPLSEKAVWWGRIVIKNNLAKDVDWILMIAERYVSVAEIYVEGRQKGQFEVHLSGLYVPKSQRDIRQRPYSCKTNLYIKAGETATVFIKIVSHDHKKPYFSLALQGRQLWNDSLQQRNLYQGFVQGILVIALIFNLLNYVITRDRTSLMYALLIVFHALFYINFYGINFEFLDIPGQWYAYLYLATTCGALCFDILFKRAFLGTSRTMPGWDTFLKANMAFTLLETTALALYNYISADFATVHQLHQVCQTAQSMLLLAFLAPVFKMRTSAAYYITLGSLVVQCAVVYSIFSINFLGRTNVYFLQSAVTVEIVMFFIGTGLRMRTIEREKRKAQEEVIRQLQAKDLVSKELKKFLYRISHDLRRPLTSLMGLKNVAQLTLKDPDAVQLFEMVNVSAQGMERMLQKLIMLHEVYDSDLSAEPMSMEATLEEVRRELEDLMVQHHIDWISKLEVDQIASVKNLWQIIVYNLVENSIFFHSKNRRKPFVKIEFFRRGDMLCLRVSDNGIGIEKEHMKDVFEMYFRGSEMATHGNGLGLFVVKKAVEKMNGEIRIESEFDKYTLIEIRVKDVLA